MVVGPVMARIKQKLILGADDVSPTVDAVRNYLSQIGADLTVLDKAGWPEVALKVAESVSAGKQDMGFLMCWTGTGTAMMANKVPGARAALCWQPWIAEGARLWNDANILVMSMKATSPEEAEKILDAWFSVTEPDPDEADNIRKLAQYEQRAQRPPKPER
jgi:ribose 5-phosphate isomerase B